MRETILHAAEAVARRHGVVPDRRDILQDGHTLVVRLSETLVARIVTDTDGPRQGSEWFARETDVAAHLTRLGAPVVPLHSVVPPVAHVENGFTLNFWEFVNILDGRPEPENVGTTLRQCHVALASYPGPLPPLAILHETVDLLDRLGPQVWLSPAAIDLLRWHLHRSIEVLAPLPAQPLHGDAHDGNLMLTTRGLLWADWEDAFVGPVEWDLASIIWNARLLDNDHATADAILEGYTDAGGVYDAAILETCLVARAAVMSAWYPVLYPNPSQDRAAKLRFRLDWLAGLSSAT